MLRLTNFAMALMGWPKVLILDEPTNELDPHKRWMVWYFLARLNRETGTTSILVTHNVLEAEKVIERVAVMKQGKIVALGTPGELKRHSEGKVRLEFQIDEGDVRWPLDLSIVASLGTLEQPRPYQYHLYLPTEQVAAATALVIGEFGLSRLKDFRLVPASLENVYLELDASQAGQTTNGASLFEVGMEGGSLMLETSHEELRTSAVTSDFTPSHPVQGLSKFLLDFKILWLEQVLEVRTTWYLFVIFSMVMPLAMVFGFARIGNSLSDRTSQLFIISGSAILTCTSDGIMGVAQRVGGLKKEGTLVYYASLPISIIENNNNTVN